MAASLSRTPEGPLAAVEAADAVAASIGDGCDLAVVFVRPEHADDLEGIGLAVEARLEPGVLIGAVAQGLVGPGEEIESGPGVVVWGARLPGADLHPFRAWTVLARDERMAVAGWPDTGAPDVVMLLADALSFPTAEVAVRLGERGDAATLTGGAMTGGPGASRFMLDGVVHDDGAVGVVLRGVEVSTSVSQGCRPVGEPLTVTAVDRNRILELGGVPAPARLQEVLQSLDDEERDLLERGGLQVGLVVDEVRDAYTTGDFLVRGVLAVDPERGSVTVGDLPAIGQTIQFQVRDAVTASADLAATLAGAAPAAGSLLFTCTGRGRGLFGAVDHDVHAVEAALGGAVAGAFCAGELGPVGGRSHLHGHSASLLSFHA